MFVMPADIEHPKFIYDPLLGATLKLPERMGVSYDIPFIPFAENVYAFLKNSNIQEKLKGTIRRSNNKSNKEYNEYFL